MDEIQRLKAEIKNIETKMMENEMQCLLLKRRLAEIELEEVREKIKFIKHKIDIWPYEN